VQLSIDKAECAGAQALLTVAVSYLVTGDSK
jgi:hypothetical protein